MSMSRLLPSHMCMRRSLLSLMDIRLSSNFLMDINVWLSSNFLMDIRFSSRVKISISNRWVIKSSINSSNWGSNSSNWLSSITISIGASSIGSSSYGGCSSIAIGSRVGIASWGNDTSLCGGQTGKDSNKGSHFSYAMLLLFECNCHWFNGVAFYTTGNTNSDRGMSGQGVGQIWSRFWHPEGQTDQF